MQLTGLEGQIFIGLGAGMGHKMTLQSVTGCGESYPSRDGMLPLSRASKTRGIHTKLENYIYILYKTIYYIFSSDLCKVQPLVNRRDRELVLQDHKNIHSYW